MTEFQKTVIRRAVGQAIDKSAEIKKLSASMNLTEDEILVVTKRVEDMKNLSSKSFKESDPKKRAKRTEWTQTMLHQLTELRNKGESVTQIAKVMGLDAQQISNKLQRIPEKLVTAAVSPPKSEPDKPAVVETPTKSDSLPADPPQKKTEKSELKSEPQPDSEEEQHGTIDMPTAMLRMMKLISDNYNENIIRVYASNDEARMSCVFVVEGIEYDLKLEVIK